MANDNENENRTLSNILAAIRQQGAAFRGAFRSDPTAPSRAREEALERAKKLRDAVANGFGIAFKKTGLSKLASFAKTGGKSILMGSAFLAAFFLLVNSPVFDKFVDFLRDTIIPGIGKLIKWLDDNGVNIKNGMKLLFEGLSSVGDFLLDTVKLMTDDNYTFEEFFNENWKGFTAAVTGLLILVGGFKAPILLALATGGVLFRMGKWMGNFFSRNGALATAANALDDAAPGGNMRGTAGARATQARARLNNMSASQLNRVQAQNPDLRITRTASGAVSVTRPNAAAPSGQSPVSNQTMANIRGMGGGAFTSKLGKFAAATGRGSLKLLPFAGMAIGGYNIFSILMDENLTAPQKLKGIIAEITGMGGAALGSIFGGAIGGTIGAPGGLTAVLSAFVGAGAGGYVGYEVGKDLGHALMGWAFGDKTFAAALPKGGIINAGLKAYKSGESMFKFAGQVFGLSSGKQKSAVEQSRSNVQKTSKALALPTSASGTGATGPKALQLTPFAQNRAAQVAQKRADQNKTTVDFELVKMMKSLQQLLMVQSDADKRRLSAAAVLGITPRTDVTIFNNAGIRNTNPILNAAAAGIGY